MTRWYEIDNARVDDLPVGPMQVVEYSCGKCQTRGMATSAGDYRDAVERIPAKCPWCEWKGDGE